MRNIKLVIQYDGTEFHGWQKQPNLRTVQGELDQAIERVTTAAPLTMASGRTDSGVHALGQVVSFQTPSRLETDVLLRALNALLPGDIRILSAVDVPLEFHATLHAVSKRYRYQVDNQLHADPFQRRISWHQPKTLDVAAMHEAGQVLLGTHDFRCFETEYPNRASSVRTIVGLDVRKVGELIQIEVEADGFLYNMVRAITGSLVLIGKRNRAPQWLADVLRGMDRRLAGPTAPPQGLFLLYVVYPAENPPAPVLPATSEPLE